MRQTSWIPMKPLSVTLQSGWREMRQLVSYERIAVALIPLLYSSLRTSLHNEPPAIRVPAFKVPIRPSAQSHKATLPLRRSVFYGKATSVSVPSVSRALRACVPLPAPTGKGRLPCRNRFLSVQWRYQLSRWLMARATRYNMQKTLLFSVIE